MHKQTLNGAAGLLRQLGLIPLIAFGLLTTLASGGGGGGGGGGASNTPGTLELRDVAFDAVEGTVVNMLVTRSGGSEVSSRPTEVAGRPTARSCG